MGHLIFTGKKRRYEEYFLTRNPFPYAGIPEENPDFCINRDAELDKIADTIDISLHAHSTHIALIGGYGNGKTHTLKYVKAEVNRQLSKCSGSKAIAGYVISPGQSLVDMYRNFAKDLGREFFIDLMWYITGETLTERVSFNKNFEKIDKNILKTIQEDFHIIKRYVEDGSILLSPALNHVRERILSLTKSTEVANALMQLIFEKTGLVAWKWLSGELTTYDQCKQLGIVSSIRSDDKVLEVFTDLKNVMKHCGYELICMFIDEFENIETLPINLKQRYLNSIRNLIDLNPHGLCLIISCTPEVWKNIVKEYHAFSERIFREILLKPLDENMTRLFIEEYLARYRLQGSNLEDPIYPFTEESIQQILQRSHGNLRRALSICNLIIDAGIDQGVKRIMPQELGRLLQ